MGQYFTSIIENKDGERVELEPGGLAKMMEWGYVENDDILSIMCLLEELTKLAPVKYLHVGDYSYRYIDSAGDSAEFKLEDKLGNPMPQGVIGPAVYELRKRLDGEEGFYEKVKERCAHMWIHNHCKKQQMSMAQYLAQGFNTEDPEDENDIPISPLALMCCTEQELGGGDFRGLFMGRKLIEGGPWLGDFISVSFESLDGFEDITMQLLVSRTIEEFDKYRQRVSPMIGSDKALGFKDVSVMGF